MANRFWVGGTAAWDGTAGTKWSTTSGGASGAAVPTSADDVFLDAASGANTVTISATASCKSLTCTGFTGTLTVTSGLQISGACTFVSGMTLNASVGTIYFIGTGSTFTLTTGGKSFSNTLRFGMDAAGTTYQSAYQLGSALLGTSSVDVQAGSFSSANFAMTCGSIAAPSSTPASYTATTITLGTSAVTLTGAAISYLLFMQGGTVLSAASATVTTTYNSTATKLFDLDVNTLGTLNIGAISSTGHIWFRNNGIINNLTITAPNSITVEAGDIITFKSVTLSGATSTSRILIKGETAASQGFISFSGKDVETDYLTVQDIQIVGNFLFAGNHSIDSGNNTNVIFNDIATYLWSSTKRNINAQLQVSWKKNYLPTIRFFTIGVSLIGGNDLINSSDSIDSRWNKYQYSDESNYLLGMEWEQGLNLPAGGISKGLAAGRLDNTTRRFTPRYMGGSNAELYTAVLPARPFIMNAGFTKDGVDYSYPEFVGLFSRQPRVDQRNRTMEFSGEDFIGFLQNRYVDNTVMYTGQRSDQLIGNILAQQGFSTSQYDLDYGINRIPFAIFNRGDRYGDIIDQISKAEYAQFFQDERGVLKFENRQHWDASPYNAVQYDIYTSQVLNAEAPDDDHIINVVEVKSQIRNKQPEQTVFRLVATDAIEVPASGTKEVFVDFQDPVLAITTPTSSSTTSYFKAFTVSDGTGTNVSTSLSISSAYVFAQSARFVFTNSTAASAFITELVVSGRPAKIEREIYLRDKDDSSVTAYQERSLVLENNYIQEESWAASLSQLILNDFSSPEKLQTITIKAIPTLKLGDLITWQGRYWRVFSKKTSLSPDQGFLQELQLLQRTITTYFRIGISTIGGSDKIAP